MRLHTKYVAKKLGLSLEAASVVAEMATQMGRLPDGEKREMKCLGGVCQLFRWNNATGDPVAWSTVFCPY